MANMKDQYLFTIGLVVNTIGISARKNDAHVQFVGTLTDLREVLQTFCDFFNKGDNLSRRLGISLE